MKNYKIVNDITGWFVFAIAAFTYCMTIEPTASFWDCPEFITTAAKLEVGHPPGAPFFMLVGNLFAQFASDASQIAKMINIMNALLSAGCILFLFWTITHFAKKMIVGSESKYVTKSQTIGIMASGVAGALIYTWSDTFWFSAVEGEVYAFSSFITALVFWLILKWENHADEPGSDRWLILIAYLVGLSIGVHLLNLLCIPAIVLVFYYKKWKNANLKGSLIALGVSVVLIAAVLYGIVPGIVKMGGWFELMFVNGIGMPYNSGLYAYLGLLVASLVWALIESTKGVDKTRMNVSFLLSTALLGIPFYGHGTTSVIIGIFILILLAIELFLNSNITPRILNTSILCMTLITVGYASYAVIVVRSTANPPMDQNSPEDIFTLGDYLSREQYGDRPLFIGETFASEPEIIEENGKLKYNLEKGAPVYQRKDKVSADEKDEYIVVHEKQSYVYPGNQMMFFPRIYSKSNEYKYRTWLGDIKTHSVDYNVGNETYPIEIPNYSENLRFFFSYQMNFMYWRYFMWNFAGRQNDIQGNGESEHGNWITGFDFIDNAILNADLSKLPSDLQNNKGHNVFYCLPLILGLLGFFWQVFKDEKSIQQFWVVFFLFFMTGIAIVIYLNQTPGQPRERDYAYAGSFYAFAIWCGLGITAIYYYLSKLLSSKRSGALIASLVSIVPALAVPLQMVSQTWDDHDRSGRYVCRDFGLNYLETVPKNGIIFTCGDNDTFPLWYNEDTEGKRTDVRVCNLSYLQTDWYIDQMKRPAYENDALPISWKRWQYTTGKHEMISINPIVKTNAGDIKASDLIDAFCEKDSAFCKDFWNGKPYEYSTVIKHFVLKEPFSPELVSKYPLYIDIISKSIKEPCIPTNVVYVTVNKDNVRKSGMMIPGDSIPDRMDISLENRSDISKSELMMLEIIANNNFERPVYMSTTVGTSNYGSLYRHFVQEGIAYRITPFTFEGNKAMMQNIIDTDKMYDNMMNKYSYGNLKQEGLYLDETTVRMCYTHRRWFSALINALIEENKMDMALKALEKCETEIPSYNVPHLTSSGSLDLANAYITFGKYDKADKILQALKKKAEEYSHWYLALEGRRFISVVKSKEYMYEINVLRELNNIYSDMALLVDDAKEKEKYSMISDNCNNAYLSFYNAITTKALREGLSDELLK